MKLSVVPLRIVYKGGEVREAQPEAAEEGKEKTKEVTADDVSKTKAEHDERVNDLQIKIDDVESEDPEIQNAANNAKEKLATLRGIENPMLNKEQIDGKIAEIKNIIENVRTYQNESIMAEEAKEDLKKSAENAKNRINESLSEDLFQTKGDHPQLSEDALAKLQQANDALKEKMFALVDKEAASIVNRKISYAEFAADNDVFDKFGEDYNTVYHKLDFTDPTFNAELDNLRAEYLAEKEGIVVIGSVENQDSWEQYVNNEGYRARAAMNNELAEVEESFEESGGKAKGKDEYLNKIKDDLRIKDGFIKRLEEGTKASLMSLNKPEDEPQRAIILANFKDELNKVNLEYEGRTEAEPVEAQAVLNTVMEMNGYKPDAYDKAYANLERGISKTSPLIDGKEGQTFIVSENADFRMNFLGAKMRTLPPGTEVVLDRSDVYSVKTEDGRKVDYVSVQVDPPNGPIGHVDITNVDFTKPIEEKGGEEMIL